MTVMKISYFKSISDRNPETIIVEQFVDDLRNGRYAKLILRMDVINQNGVCLL